MQQQNLRRSFLSPPFRIYMNNNISKEWLKYKTTIQDSEDDMVKKANKYHTKLSKHWLVRWDRFKSHIKDGDELWFYEHFPEPMTGGAGYCILRNGTVVASIATMRS
jgi:hypothetical protein